MSLLSPADAERLALRGKFHELVQYVDLPRRR